MKSRITIAVDFDSNNQPVLEIIAIDSEDVRDKLLKAFYQSLGGTSNTCKLEFSQVQRVDAGDPTTRILIRPVSSQDLRTHCEGELIKLGVNFASIAPGDTQSDIVLKMGHGVTGAGTRHTGVDNLTVTNQGSNNITLTSRPMGREEVECPPQRFEIRQ